MTAIQCRECSGIGAVVSEQYLQQTDISGLDQMNIETSFEARVADVRIGMQIKAKFRRKATWSVRDVYFVRA